MSPFSKEELRILFKKKRLILSQQEVEERSKLICTNFLNNLLPKLITNKTNVIFSLYISSYNEVSTKTISNFFIQNKIRFSYPKIIGKDRPLKFIFHKNGQDLEPSKIFPSIKEPKEGEEIYPNYLIIPLVAFDKKLSRLGMGSGLFDRTIAALKKQNNKITTIGLAYDFQGYKHDIPNEITDQKPCFIVTEKTIFSAN